MSYTCPDCKNTFLSEPVCVTCGAQRLYDVTVETLGKQVDALRLQLSTTRRDALEEAAKIAADACEYEGHHEISDAVAAEIRARKEQK